MAFHTPLSLLRKEDSLLLRELLLYAFHGGMNDEIHGDINDLVNIRGNVVVVRWTDEHPDQAGKGSSDLQGCPSQITVGGDCSLGPGFLKGSRYVGTPHILIVDQYRAKDAVRVVHADELKHDAGELAAGFIFLHLMENSFQSLPQSLPDFGGPESGFQANPVCLNKLRAEGLQQVLFIFEMPVKSATGHLCLTGNIIECRFSDPFTVKEVKGGVEQCLACLFTFLFCFSHRFHIIFANEIP